VILSVISFVSFAVVVFTQGIMCTSVITDSHFLKDNLLCLVSNAVKYADVGATIDVRISLLPASPSQQQPMVMVVVEDTGIGISDENKVVLFQPFQQAQRSAGGTGLGLFSLAGRIRALEGTCGVRDRADGKQGSVFWFTFPYRPDELSDPVDEASMSAQTPRAPEAQPYLPPLRILLTDDSVSIVKVTKRFLEKHGHTVETAENGNQSLKRLKQNCDDFDLMITDLQMPVMDGFESVRRFREFEQQPQQQQGASRLFIVGMSAKADEETRCDVFAVGMDAFVSKPFDYKTLVDELKRSPTFAETLRLRQKAVRLSRDTY
jgi:CheY-like chemotaxis protein